MDTNIDIDNLKPFHSHELAGVELLKFDIYDENGNIIANRGQTIDPGMLLRLQFLRLFRKSNEDTEYCCLDNLLISETNKKILSKLLNQLKGIVIISSSEANSRKLLLKCIVEYKSPKAKVYIITDSEFESEFPVNKIKPENLESNLYEIKTRIFQNNNVVIFDTKNNEKYIKLACENFASHGLVIITANKPNCLSALSHISKTYPDKMLLSSLLRGIIAQQPVLSLCSCKKSYYPDEKEIYSYFKEEPYPKILLYKPNGCNLCKSTGIFGTMQLHEVLNIDDSLREIIINDINTDQLGDAILKQDFKDIRHDGFKKAICGLVPISEADKVNK